MGYYSDFSIRLIGTDEHVNECFEWFDRQSLIHDDGDSHEMYYCMISEDGPPEINHKEKLISADYVKWYDWQDDLIKFSELFPKISFDVIKTGEIFNPKIIDLKRIVFSNGKTAELTPTINWHDSEGILRGQGLH